MRIGKNQNFHLLSFLFNFFTKKEPKHKLKARPVKEVIDMSFNSAMLKELLSKSDKELWMTLRLIAAKSGVSLPEAQPGSTDMQKLRHALSGAGNHSFEEATKLLDAYRKGKTSL